jgi:hypothetical protein
MGASHHGQSPKSNPELDALMRRFIQQVEGRAPREYPAGRVGPDDEGALACAIAADKQHGRVRLDFGKLIAWFSVTPEEAVQLAELLIAKAREATDRPITVNV